jgi:hypothetical protein
MATFVATALTLRLILAQRRTIATTTIMPYPQTSILTRANRGRCRRHTTIDHQPDTSWWFVALLMSVAMVILFAVTASVGALFTLHVYVKRRAFLVFLGGAGGAPNECADLLDW